MIEKHLGFRKSNYFNPNSAWNVSTFFADFTRLIADAYLMCCPATIKAFPRRGARLSTHLREMFLSLAALFCIMAFTGCRTPQFAGLVDEMQAKSEPVVLHEGDVVNIKFPGAPTMDVSQQIQRDGRLRLQLIGEIYAAGLTPSELEAELSKAYSSQLLAKEVVVTIQSSAFPIYVSGAVLRPGKIISDHPITALEAIMEAGGFDYGKANVKAVAIIRHENGQTEHFKLNLKRVLSGEDTEQFALKPSDIIYVPERFVWF
jgi:polysaccharide biosynthesis/export protein